MNFLLGTHMPAWLDSVDVPLFVSAIRLRKRRTHRPALQPWALDSGGFSELTTHRRWTVGPEQYADEVRTWGEAIGRLCWAAVQDWMCEPHVRSLTGLSVREHQERTVASLHRLRALAPEVPWVPVLQGWEPGDYFEHLDLYASEGVDLRAEPLVGIGSVCRRQGTAEALGIIRDLAAEGVKLHGFGFKVSGLTQLAAEGGGLVSADSLAWSYQARKRDPLPGCTHTTCANCKRWALSWRADLLARVSAIEARPQTFALFEPARGLSTDGRRRAAERELAEAQRIGALDRQVAAEGALRREARRGSPPAPAHLPQRQGVLFGEGAA